MQRDEAAAAAEEHAAEQRMQDVDAARRLAILRGETPPPLPEPEQPADPSDKQHTRRDRDGAFSSGAGGAGRKRKRAGEDDTDFEMRVARERAEEGARVAGELAGEGGSKRQKQDVSIVDSRGHIDLVGPPTEDALGGGGGGDVTRGETVRGRNATGTRGTVEKFERNDRKEVLAGKQWYEQARRRQPFVKECHSTACEAGAATIAERPESEREDLRKAMRDAEKLLEGPTTSAFGQPDPKRKDREAARLDANDPLAAMRSGAKQVREVTRERRREAEDRLRELEQLRKEERRRGRREKRERARADGGGHEGERDHGHSGRSERRHHGDERHESRRDHSHREERRRRRDDERARDREDDKDYRRERQRSRERGASSRSHRDRDRDDRHDHRGKDHERRDREAKRVE